MAIVALSRPFRFFVLSAYSSLLVSGLFAIATASGQSENVQSEVPTPVASEEHEFFEKQVRPILAEHCWKCHSGEAGESKGSLRLDHSTFILQGGDSGAALVPGDPAGSLLFQSVNYDGYEMPPDGKIAQQKIDVLKKWIASGAYWPEEPLPESKEPQEAFDLEARRESFWVWQPRVKVTPPVVIESTSNTTGSNGEVAGGSAVTSKASMQAWSSTSIDPFVLQRMSEAGLEPNPQADRATLVRRAYLDLIGLPPSPEELRFYVESQNADWYPELIDSLLANPQFGVRWARHWLDLVRFAQSRGHEFDEDIPSAEPYRDYVIRAWNADVPFDQFLREHLAGDLLESPRTDPAMGWNESVIGTGFWHFGEWVHSPVDARKDETDRLDNMVDVFSKTFLGMTVACARCHDHKFDAISQEDYYAIYGFLRSSDYRLVRFETDLQHRSIAKERSQIHSQIESKALGAIKQILEQTSKLEAGPDTPQAKLAMEVAGKINQVRGLASTLAAPKDPNVVWDARDADRTLWQSDSVIYGSGPSMVGSLSLAQSPNGPAWMLHRATEASRDLYWNPMTQTSHGVNRQNRNSQVQEAGKLMPTKKFTLNSGKVSYLVRGAFRAFASIDSHRLIAGPLHGEVLFENGGPDNEYRWVTQSLDRYKGKTVHIELSPLQDKPFGLVQVIDGVPPAVAPSAAPDVASSVAVWNDVRELALKQISDSPNGQLSVADQWAVSQWTSSLLESKDIVFPNTLPPEVSQRATEAFDVLSKSAVESRDQDQQFAARTTWHSQLALAMRDGSGINDALLIRGNHLRPGAEVPRRNLEALGGKQRPYLGSGSGRLALAQELIASDNPLVARVISNRLWHHLLGRGIVATTDDFGVLGMRPTHPELLDYLSNSLIAQGWSLKGLIREICLSNTYRQDARPSVKAAEVDPQNNLLSHARIRRLESEALRDTLMAIADELDLRGTTPEAPCVPVHLTEFLDGRGRPGRNGPLDGGGKRSIYLEVRRNFLNPMMLTFDTPSPFSTMGRRNVSNVPAQSLILLNDPFVHQLADRWADRVLQVSENDSERIRWMWVKAFSREPTAAEIEITERFVRSSDFANRKDAYRSLAHMVMNNKEAIYRF